jgi:alkanesulfonate monooxygenase SsuD/methylene tetrahydromethanopterin reductase-like flavin-dependent oxidoreductase (luciferase family)
VIARADRHLATEQPLRRGIWLFPGVAAGALVDAVVAAEQLGLDEVWIADEGVAREPIPVLAAAAVRTDTIRLGVGVTSPLLRHPGAIAASIATLDELSEGRAVLGLGIGGDLSLAPFGLDAERPVALLSNAIETARDVLTGRHSDRYRVPPHAMPPRNVPIWVGARGPQLVRTAARRADGLFVSGCTPRQHDEIAAMAASIRTIPMAVYQSAVDRPRSPVEQDWDAAHAVIDDTLARLQPAAIGINLADLAGDRPIDVIALVARSAELLHGVSMPNSS